MNLDTIIEWAEKYNIDPEALEDLLNQLDHEEAAEEHEVIAKP